MMIFATLVTAFLAFVLLVINWQHNSLVVRQSLSNTVQLTLQTLPLLFFSLLVANLITGLIPTNTLVKWIGNKSGWKGILIGSLAGSFVSGGPYVALPIAGSLLKTGAGLGTTVSFLTGWSLWAFSRLPMEIGLLGWRFALVRFGSTFIFSPLAGFLAEVIFIRN